MLELLSGPTAISYLNALAAMDAVYAFPVAAQYDDDVGLIVTEDAVFLRSWVVQLDGAACLRGKGYGEGKLIIDAQRGGEYLLRNVGNSVIYFYDKRAATRTDALIAGASGDFVAVQVRASDRFLQADGAAVKWKPLDNSAGWVTETTLTGAGSGAPCWSIAALPNIMALAYADGKIIYYNLLTKLQVAGANFIGTNEGAWYSKRHNIWLKMTDAASPALRRFYVYAATVRPTALSSPTGAAALRGRVTSFTVRATGSDGEAVPGELVDWSLLSGVGQLLAAQSTTDDDGYASIDYAAPVTGTLSNTTIKAELRC